MPNTINQWVAYLSTDKQKTNTQRITNDHVSAAKSRVEIREILPPAQTHTMDERSQIHPEYARKNQTTLNALSTDKIELHIKDMKSVVRGGHQKFQTLELTCCHHVGLFVHSHPKFKCQNTRNQWVAYLAALSAGKQDF